MKLFHKQPPVVIFSVFNTRSDKEANIRDSVEASRYLEARGIPYKVVEGMFNGDIEVSFVVPARFLEWVNHLAWMSDQDQFLFLNEDRDAFTVIPGIIHGEDVFTPIGKWVKSWCKPKGDYTYDASIDQYYEVI